MIRICMTTIQTEGVLLWVYELGSAVLAISSHDFNNFSSSPKKKNFRSNRAGDEKLLNIRYYMHWRADLRFAWFFSTCRPVPNCDDRYVRGNWLLNHETIRLVTRQIRMRKYNRYIYKLWVLSHQIIPV